MPTAARMHRSTPPPLKGDGRPSACRRGYGRGWQAIRLNVLREEPVCEDCDRAPSVHVDHVVALEKGGTHDRSNLRALCPSCHSKKTCRVDGGFGRRKDAR